LMEFWQLNHNIFSICAEISTISTANSVLVRP
jgi:hypothetical protein